VRIQTVDPSAFEMPDAPANEAGVFFEGRFAGSSFHKADIARRSFCLHGPFLSAIGPKQT
jgi:hypothetical protein